MFFLPGHFVIAGHADKNTADKTAGPTYSEIAQIIITEIELYEYVLNACLGCKVCRAWKKLIGSDKSNHVETRLDELVQLKNSITKTNFNERQKKSQFKERFEAMYRRKEFSGKFGQAFFKNITTQAWLKKSKDQ